MVMEKQKATMARNSGDKCRETRSLRFSISTSAKPMAAKLLKDGRIRLKDCVSSRTGKLFDADLLMAAGPDGKPQFSLSFDKPNRERRKNGNK